MPLLWTGVGPLLLKPITLLHTHIRPCLCYRRCSITDSLHYRYNKNHYIFKHLYILMKTTSFLSNSNTRRFKKLSILKQFVFILVFNISWSQVLRFWYQGDFIYINIYFSSGRSTAPCGSDILQYYAGQDATQVWEMANHSPRAKEMMASYFVGNYMDPELEVVQVRDRVYELFCWWFF